MPKKLLDGRTPNDYAKGTGIRVTMNLEPVTISMLSEMSEREGKPKSEIIREAIREKASILGIQGRAVADENTMSLW